MSTPLAQKVFALFGTPAPAKAAAPASMQEPSSPSWPCPDCQGPVTLQPPQADELPTRFWTCEGCGTWGATREGAAFPVVWVSPKTVQ